MKREGKMANQKRDNAITLILQLIESIKMADSDREDLRDAVNQISYKAVDKYEHMMQGFLIYKKLCESTSCRDCPLSYDNNDYHQPCAELMTTRPIEAAKILEKWNDSQEKEVKNERKS